MADYIKRSALIAEFKRLGLGANSLVERIFADGVYAVIETMPAADVEPVVRCPECKYHHDCGTHFCDRLGMDCPDDSEFFCKYGARMDGAE